MFQSISARHCVKLRRRSPDFLRDYPFARRRGIDALAAHRVARVCEIVRRIDAALAWQKLSESRRERLVARINGLERIDTARRPGAEVRR